MSERPRPGVYYEETISVPWPFVALLVAIGVAVPASGLLHPASGHRPGSEPPWYLLAFFGPFFIALALTLSRLRLVVEEERFVVAFGPIRKVVPVDRVTACEPVRLGRAAAWSWGIHMQGWRTWLWSVPVKGGLAVSLQVGRGRLIVSTQHPEEVCQAVAAAKQAMRKWRGE